MGKRKSEAAKRLKKLLDSEEIEYGEFDASIFDAENRPGIRYFLKNGYSIDISCNIVVINHTTEKIVADLDNPELQEATKDAIEAFNANQDHWAPVILAYNDKPAVDRYLIGDEVWFLPDNSSDYDDENDPKPVRGEVLRSECACSDGCDDNDCERTRVVRHNLGFVREVTVSDLDKHNSPLQQLAGAAE